MGFPQLSSIYGYVGVTGSACSCAGWEGAAQHPRKTHTDDITKASPAWAYFCQHSCFSMLRLRQYQYLEFGGESQPSCPFGLVGLTPQVFI